MHKAHPQCTRKQADTPILGAYALSPCTHTHPLCSLHTLPPHARAHIHAGPLRPHSFPLRSGPMTTSVRTLTCKRATCMWSSSAVSSGAAGRGQHTGAGMVPVACGVDQRLYTNKATGKGQSFLTFQQERPACYVFAVYLPMHAHACTHTGMHVHTPLRAHPTPPHSVPHTYVQAAISTSATTAWITHTHTHGVCMHTYTASHTSTPPMHVCPPPHTHAYAHTLATLPGPHTHTLSPTMHVCTLPPIHTHMHMQAARPTSATTAWTAGWQRGGASSPASCSRAMTWAR